jgi:putative ubiquitin-RnfH superfamily antitoxin RatB of RatAB toxin-antitoxin module
MTPTDGASRIVVEVAYAAPARVVVRCYEFATPATVADALERVNADEAFAGIELAAGAIGIFGRLVAPSAPLADGDRVELYRPLAADPKTARRARVRDARRMRQ